MARNLAGKVALITGAAGGIGSAIAELFDAKGIRLALTDIDVTQLKEHAGKYRQEPFVGKCDITSRSDIIATVEKVKDHFGRIDILVNNAGIIIPSLYENAEYDDINKQVAVNLLGPMYMTRAVLPVMKDGEGGAIITVSSLAGIVPETRSGVYAATKFALRGFNLTINIELKERGIFAGAVFPDSVNTPMLRYEATHGGSPLTFLGPPQQPEQVAEAVYRAIVKKKIESYVPYSTAFFSKILACIPWIFPPVWRMLEISGEKKKKKFQEKLKKEDAL